MTLKRIVTIGVYGFTEAGFFQALQDAGVDTFCDVRWRRGVRGAAYAFANSERLQARLAEMGIRYLHFKELAPSPAIRARQYSADKAAKIAKRQRSTLSPDFVRAYEDEVLINFRAEDFLEPVSPGRVAALFCVEREPAACHRSLLAERLAQATGLAVEHIEP